MNKRLLLPIFVILCSAASHNVVAKTYFELDLSEETAKYLIDRALHLTMNSYQTQQEADAEQHESSAKIYKEMANEAKHIANRAEQNLIKFGNAAQIAKENIGDSNCLAGKTSASALFADLQTRIVEEIQKNINDTNETLNNLREWVIKISQEAIERSTEADQATQNNSPADVVTDAQRKASLACLIATQKNNDVNLMQEHVDFYENILKTIYQNFDDKIAALNTKPAFGATFTQYAKVLITNKWAKRVAGILVTCGICMFVYNRYNQSNKSNDEENDDE
ncbi:MAG TPA: hypothetical protein VGT41_03195 [Candidatus Babeliales bacterium]|nr:hypothetical protein [Candidatus Babeliales bacterium]